MSDSASSFDFADFNPKDPWSFPPERLIHFAESAGSVFKASRNKWVRTRPHPDARFVVFHELHHATFNLMIHAHLIREKGLDQEWWNSLPQFPGKFDEYQVRFNHIGLRENLRYAFMNTLARQIEMAFRQVFHVLAQDAPEDGANAFKKVYRALLKRTDLQEYDALLQLIFVVRDSLPYSGKFCPANRKNLTLAYKGKTFTFQNEESIEPQDFGFIDLWEFILYLVRQTDRMLNEVFEAPLVAILPFVKTRHTG